MSDHVVKPLEWIADKVPVDDGTHEVWYRPTGEEFDSIVSVYPESPFAILAKLRIGSIARSE